MGQVSIRALSNINLELYEGELLVLLGPSGSGKSTLLNILGGLDLPSTGQVYFHHQLLTQAGDRGLTQFRRRFVGFVFQFYNLIPSLTAKENVALVTDIARHGMSPEAALATVDLSDRLDHFPLSSLMASSKESPLPERSLSSQRCCYATSQWARWTFRPANAYSKHSCE